MASPPRLPNKKDVALALLEHSSIYVHLDPRDESVRVPAWFKRQPQLVLQIGLNMPLPIPDLRVEDDGISCTLSFSRTPHFCWIPWSSVFALVGDNGRAMVWPDDVPKEVIAAQAAQAQKAQPERPKLHAVAEQEKADTQRPAAAEAAPEKPAKKKRAKKAAAKAEPRAKPKATAAKAPSAGAARKKAGESSVAAAPPAPATRSNTGDKRRRALPPYLRVIK